MQFMQLCFTLENKLENTTILLLLGLNFTENSSPYSAHLSIILFRALTDGAKIAMSSAYAKTLQDNPPM